MQSLSPEFRTRQEVLDIEGQRVELSVITNFDELLDRLIAKGEGHEDVRDERIPYWADLWPSALALGRFLVQEQLVRPGMSVTEIGCGLGLPGIIAGRLGARVTFSDYLPEALDFARHNWSQNLPHSARFALMDWRHPDPALAAGLLLASDVAYEQRAFDYLPHAFRTLCKPGGAILVSEPNRAIAAGFFSGLASQGFRVEQYSLQGVYNKLPYRVNVYRLSVEGPHTDH